MSRLLSERAHLPDSLRSPELHDFSDVPPILLRVPRQVMIFLALAGLAVLGHFALDQIGSSPEVVQHASPMARV